MGRETITCSPLYKQERQFLEDVVPEMGLSGGIIESNKRIHTDVMVLFASNEEGIRDSLKGGGLIIANHEGVEDPRALLASVPQRRDENGVVKNDLYGVSDVENINLYGPVMRNLMIPTVTDNQVSHKLARKLGGMYGMKKQIYSEQDLMKENMKTTMSILRVIKNSGLVMLFPQGIQGAGSQWRGGIGGIMQMLQRLPNLNDLSYTSAHIEGTGFFDFRIYVPGWGKIAPLKPKVTYLETLPLSTAFEIASTPVHQESYKDTDKLHDRYTIELQKRYEEQVDALAGYQLFFKNR